MKKNKSVDAEETREEAFTRELRSKVATHLKQCSENGALTNDGLAKILGISPSRLNHLKRGEFGDLSPYFLANLARFLQISLDELITGKHPTNTIDAGPTRTAEMERKLFLREQTAIMETILASQNGSRALTAELGKSIFEALERRAEELKSIIVEQGTKVIVPTAPNQITKAEIAELERDSTHVWVSSRALPYIGRGMNQSSDFLDVEADCIYKGHEYRYFIGGVLRENEASVEERFKDLLRKEWEGMGDQDRFEKNLKDNLKIVFSRDPNRPVFSWALHRLDPTKNISPWLRTKYADYLHELSSDDKDGSFIGGRWVGHLCFSLKDQKVFLLMPRAMLKRVYLYFQSEMNSKDTSETSSL